MSITTPQPADPGLPDLSSDYPLTAGQAASFREKGHICLRGVASAEEVAAYRPVINRAAERYNTETRPMEERDTYGKAFLQIMNLWVRDEGVKRFTLARRFARIAAELMGSRGVRIYHDQALFKEPGGGPTPWHQDQHYWPLDTDRTITMWMPLVPVDSRMGIMKFASGSQRIGYLGDLPISDRSEEALRSVVAKQGLRVETYEDLRPGDATFHAGWTLHSSPGNSTSVMREVMTIIYHDMDARVIEPDSKSRQDDVDRWLTGLKPGDVAASPLNPVVYAE
jgi:ectoine hydroxylase-related dioxygenase (phytanoyl-CoA dioxygenase family)